MRSKRIIRLSSLLIIIICLAYFSYAFAQNNPPQKALDKKEEGKIKIESIENRLTEIDVIKREIEALKKEDKERLNSIKEYSESVKNHHESIKGYIELLSILKKIIFTVVGLILSIIALIFVKNKKIINWLIKDIRDDCYKALEEKNNRSLMKIYLLQGFFHYSFKDHQNHDGLTHAIYFTEKALNIAYDTLGKDKIFKKENDYTDEDEELIGRILGNLSYYRAEKEDFENYSFLVKSALRTLEIGEKLHSINLIDNYLFVMHKLSNKISIKEKQDALGILETYGPSLKQICSDSDLEGYRNSLS